LAQLLQLIESAGREPKAEPKLAVNSLTDNKVKGKEGLQLADVLIDVDNDLISVVDDIVV
jgi:hypothetical protein